MTSLFLLLAATIGAEQGASNSRFTDSAPIVRGRKTVADDPRGYHEYQQQISELFKRESQAKDQSARAAAVRAMCDLHGEIVRDVRYGTSDVLKEYRGRLWSRLTKVKTELKQHLARDSKNNKERLANTAVLESADAASVAAADSLASSLALLDQAQGGPGYLLSYGGLPGPPDFGPDLVDLIERTINPAFWDVVGGPGTIVYYAPLQCLVVRATAEVHGNIGGLVGGLRDAGK
jgi:hypothetical protein